VQLIQRYSVKDWVHMHMVVSVLICLSVCLSITCWYWVQKNEYSTMQISPSHSAGTIVPWDKIPYKKFTAEQWTSKARPLMRLTQVSKLLWQLNGVIPSYLCTICTLLKSIDSVLSFSADNIGLRYLHSLQHSTHRAPEQWYRVKWCIMVVQGHSRSSTLIPAESPYVISL